MVFPGCTYAEVGPAVTLLTPYTSLFVASVDGLPVRTSEGLTLVASGSFAEAARVHASVVVVPGGAIDEGLSLDLDALLTGALAEGAVLGGICNGALLLAKAGVLDGRRATHTAVPEYAPRPEFEALLVFAEPLVQRHLYVDADVVVDQACVTAKPWAAIGFAEALLTAIGVDADQVGRAGAYLRGARRPG